MDSRAKRLLRLAAWTGAASVLALSHAHAQGQPAQPSRDRMLIEAKELVYNNDKNTVEASGDVQIFYQGRTLEADRVIYNRATKRVFAEGNARLTESNGQLVTGSRFELTDDFRDGFIDTLRTENPDRSRFAAPRAERAAGDTTSFQTGTYTACEPCKDNPERPPLWQVRSQRIIHKGDEKTIYFENSTLEFAGVPIAYVPYFWSPDSTVRRKTGLLAPTVYSSTQLGVGVGLPIFLNLAPNYDLTLTPTFFSRQGFLGLAEWRHRLMTGSYTIRAAGIFQQDPDVYAPAPIGPGNRNFRGMVETFGHFDINRNWRFGWDVSAVTDPYFYRNYRLRANNLTATYFREITSQVYLNGQSANAWFDMRAYHFKPLSYLDWGRAQPVVHPVLDYNKRFAAPSWLGGELQISGNVTSLTRDQSAFQTLSNPGNAFGTAYLVNNAVASYYEGCFLYSRGECVLRGVGGTVSRASLELSWRRRLIDPAGSVWTPYASLRADAFHTSLNSGGLTNDFQGRFGQRDGGFARLMPAVGLTWEYPLLITGAGNHVISPVAQIVARPNESNILRTPNEDSQSVFFDDTNLFAMSRFSGFDRNEGGVRAAYGLNYSGTFVNGAYANAMFGQSYQLGGVNSYAALDMANSGLNTGLETRRSDYVSRIQFSPSSGTTITAKGRFDEKTFATRAIEVSASMNFDPLWLGVTYARYEAQPERAQPFRREGIALSGSLKLGQFWSARGGVLYDLSKYIRDRDQYLANVALGRINPVVTAAPSTPKWAISAMSLGLRYQDECTTFDVSYLTSFRDTSEGTRARTNQALVFRLELRTLGAVNFRQAVGEQGATGLDGIRN